MPAVHKKIRGLENHYHPWIWDHALFSVCFSANSPWSVNRSWESLNSVSLRLSPRFPELWKADSCPPHRPVLIQVPCLMSGSHVESPTFTVFSLSFFSALRRYLKGQVITSLLGSKNSNVSLFPKPSWASKFCTSDLPDGVLFSPNFSGSPGTPSHSVSPKHPLPFHILVFFFAIPPWLECFPLLQFMSAK